MRNLWVGFLLVACWSQVDDGGELSVVEDVVCEDGALRCDGQLLQLCIENGTTWASLEVCETAELCDPTLGCQ
jgi:hypothetical protein